VLQLESDLQQARLEIEERDRTIERLRSEAASARDGVRPEAERLARSEVERFAALMAVPLTQFLTQEHLHRTGIAEVQVSSVIDVGLRLMRVLGGAGVEPIGTVGASEPFDPDRHDPLSTSASPDPGQQVVVRVVGLALRHQVLRKAGIEVAGSEAA
jgi:molecular chaperone GrpE (heat shock protein)